MSDLFVKLMEQIEMPLDMRRSSAFSSADSLYWSFYHGGADPT